MFDLDHSPIGGSSALRVEKCAFSFLEHRQQLQDGTFEEITSEFAEIGTGAHELGALCLVDGSEPYEHVGRAFNGYRAGYEGEIGLDSVSIYVAECRALTDRYYRPDDGDIMLIEETIHLKNIHPLLKGTVDYGMFSIYRGLYLRDYKNGEGVGVAAFDSRQLLYYAFLMILAQEDWKNIPRDLRVSLGIIQPNFYGLFEEPDVWETNVGYVLDWGINKLIPMMNARMQRNAPHGIDDTAYGSWCQFCPVTLSCPLLRAAWVAYAEGNEDFVTMLSNEEMSDLYGMRGMVKTFGNALDRAVYARKVTGVDIPSAKLVEKKVARVWKPGAAAAARAKFGEAAYKPKEMLSPAGIEKLSSAGKEFSKEWGYKPDGGQLTVAPLSDPRAVAQPRTNKAIFEKYEQSFEDQGF